MKSNSQSRSQSHKSKDYRPQTVEELTKRNVETILELEEAAKAARSTSDRFASTIASFCGSMSFVWLHVVWFAVWIALNAVPGMPHFDPFPFTFLTLCVSLEAIFLSTFILISQNHETRLSERRNHLDLQVNLLAEQENTKMLSLLIEIAETVGVRTAADSTVQILEQTTRPGKLAEQIEERFEQDG